VCYVPGSYGETLPIEIKNFSVVANCPVDLHAYDAQGNHTGLVDGEIEQNIPHSFYSGDGEPEVLVILKQEDHPEEIYNLEIQGTGEGTFGLQVSDYITVEGEDIIATINLQDMPVSLSDEIPFRYDFSQIEDEVVAQLEPEDDVIVVLEEVISSIDSDSDGEPDITDTEPMTVTVTVDIHPDVLNPASEGNWITCYIEAESFDVNQIDISSLRFGFEGLPAESDPIEAESGPIEVGDYDGDGILDLMVKFNREEVLENLSPGKDVSVTVTGRIPDFIFKGSDIITILNKS